MSSNASKMKNLQHDSVVKSLQSFGVHDLNEQMYNHYKKEVLKQNKALKSYYRTPEKRFIFKTSSNFREQFYDTIIQQYSVKNKERKHNVELLQKSIIDQHKLLIHVLKKDNSRLYDVLLKDMNLHNM